MKTGKIAILSFALGLVGCATSQAPLDDAYYWPDKHEASVAATTDRPNPTISSGSSDIDYINIQDTTVTIRVRK